MTAIKHNIYDYRTGTAAVPLQLLDVSNCYGIEEKQDVQFLMSGTAGAKKDSERFLADLEKLVLKKVAQSSDILFYRVNNFRLYSRELSGEGTVRKCTDMPEYFTQEFL